LPPTPDPRPPSNSDPGPSAFPSAALAERLLGYLLIPALLAGHIAFAVVVWHLFHDDARVPGLGIMLAWGILGLGAGAVLLVLHRRHRFGDNHGAHQQDIVSNARRVRDYQRVFRHAGDGMLVCDPADGTILDANGRACEVYEVPFEHILGRPLSNLTHSAPLILARFRKVLADRSAQNFETVHYRADGTPLHLEIVASATEFGGRTAVLAVQRDVSERRTLENQLRHQVFHDSLTGVANRALFRERAEHAFARRGRNGTIVAVLLVDLDNFKDVNDTLGHEAGDHLLIGIARRLGALLRAADTVARLGGDEFAILLEDAESLAHCEMVAERILQEFSVPFVLQGREVFVGTSIGVATSDHGEALDEVLRRADMAMYTAKSRGKGSFEVFHPQMHETIAERQDLQADLFDALDRREFVLHYMPIVDLRSARITGVEALLRWNHPLRGQMEPGAFLPLAEETGFIVPLGEWVFEEACRQVALWQQLPEHGGLSVTVNIASRQFHNTDVVALVERCLRRNGLRAASLVLEARESVLMQDLDDTVSRLQQLDELGVRVAIDDFGTGFSNLNHLSRLRVHLLKIDRSFVGDVGRGARDAPLVLAVLALAETLGIATVAEGVQDVDQLKALQALGCEYGQGFLFSAPREAAAIQTLLERAAPLPCFGREAHVRPAHKLAWRQRPFMPLVRTSEAPLDTTERPG